MVLQFNLDKIRSNTHKWTPAHKQDVGRIHFSLIFSPNKLFILEINLFVIHVFFQKKTSWKLYSLISTVENSFHYTNYRIFLSFHSRGFGESISYIRFTSHELERCFSHRFFLRTGKWTSLLLLSIAFRRLMQRKVHCSKTFTGSCSGSKSCGRPAKEGMSKSLFRDGKVGIFRSSKASL